MKIFQTIQKNFAMLGISANQTRERSSINFKNSIAFVLILLNFCSQFINLIFLADNFEEYTICIYAFFTVMMFEMEFGIHVWKMTKLFKFIENFQRLIESSELNRNYPIMFQLLLLIN